MATLHVWKESPNPTPPYASKPAGAHEVQTAIDAAAAGDRIIIHGDCTNGHCRYTENIVVDKGGMTLQGIDWPILDGGRRGQVIVFDGRRMGAGRFRRSILRTTVVCNGRSRADGAGVAVLDCAALIDSNCIHDNTTAGNGGGVLARSGGRVGVMLYGNHIHDNFALFTGGGVCYTTTPAARAARGTNVRNLIGPNNRARDGGGVSIFRSRVLIHRDDIRHNEARRLGGGIYLAAAPGGTSPNFQGLLLRLSNLFQNRGGHGGGVFADRGSQFDASSVTFRENRARGSGGGVGAVKAALRFTTSNDFLENSAGRMGGAVLGGGKCRLELRGDAAFEGNKAGDSGGGWALIDTTVDGSATNMFLFQGNKSGARGGAISATWSAASGKFDLVRARVVDNEAAHAGALLLEGNAPITVDGRIENVDFEANKAAAGPLGTAYAGVHVSGRGQTPAIATQTIRPNFYNCRFALHDGIAAAITGDTNSTTAGSGDYRATAFDSVFERNGTGWFMKLAAGGWLRCDAKRHDVAQMHAEESPAYCHNSDLDGEGQTPIGVSHTRRVNPGIGGGVFVFSQIQKCNFKGHTRWAVSDPDPAVSPRPVFADDCWWGNPAGPLIAVPPVPPRESVTNGVVPRTPTAAAIVFPPFPPRGPAPMNPPSRPPALDTHVALSEFFGPADCLGAGGGGGGGSGGGGGGGSGGGGGGSESCKAPEPELPPEDGETGTIELRDGYSVWLDLAGNPTQILGPEDGIIWTLDVEDDEELPIPEEDELLERPD